MSDDLVRGLRSGLGTLAVALVLILSNKKTITKKIEKMSEGEVKGSRMELGTLDVVLALTPSNKNQSPKKEGSIEHVVIFSATVFMIPSLLSMTHLTADVPLGTNK